MAAMFIIFFLKNFKHSLYFNFSAFMLYDTF